MRTAHLVSAVLIGASFSAVSQSAQPAAGASESPKVVTTQIARTGRTISNQPLKLPEGGAEMVAASVDIAAGAATPIHQHPWSRFVYVEKGTLRVVNHDTGETRDFKSGAVLPEVVAQWHEGRALSEPVRIIVIDIVPPGATNMVMRPADKM